MTAPETPLDWSSLTVLVVDDHMYFRQICLSVLKGAGTGRILQAGDGAQALSLLKVQPVDVALIDFVMVPLDGIELCRMIRTASDSSNPYLPILLVTGHTTQKTLVEALSAGVHDFIAKPITAKSLTQRIERVIQDQVPFVRNGRYFGPDRSLMLKKRAERQEKLKANTAMIG
ncbi:MAG: response regulator [Rhodospirillales bacterium]|nr:response regulator [Rhodospirillales bacterium]